MTSERRVTMIRQALAVLFVLPVLGMYALEWQLTAWPATWRVAGFILVVASLAAGWGPAKRHWQGEDFHLYVDEPEVDDDWR